MRLLIVNSNWGGGGPGSIASDLYNVAKSEGHSCLFVYGRGSIPQNIESVKLGSDIDIYCHALGARLFDRAGFFSDGPTKKLIDVLSWYKPDIINIHNPLGYSFNVERIVKIIKNSKIKTFWTMHDCWLFTGHCITNLCEKVRIGCGNCPQKNAFPKSWFIDNSVRNYKRKKAMMKEIPNLSFITPSKWIADMAKMSFLSEYTFYTIPNGIDLSKWYPRISTLKKQHQLEGKILLLSVANVWEETKGACYVNELATILSDDYRLVVIGKISSNVLTDYKIIHIEQTKNQAILAEWYSLADIFINPTVGDNFPTVNLEALACGTPVITFDTGGSPESIGLCGDVVPARDISVLKKTIEKCLKQRITVSQCIEQAKKFDKTVRFKEYLDLFQS